MTQTTQTLSSSSPPLLRSVILLLTLLLITTSAHGAESVSASIASCIVKAAQGSYGYDPLQGKSPGFWGGMKGFETCSQGKIQSPIDFPVSSDTLSFKGLYSDGPKTNLSKESPPLFTFTPGSENWALSCATPRTCGSTFFNGTTFHVANLHFHTPAEHTLNGQQYPLEAHIVHANAEATQFLVIATLFEYPKDDDYGAVVHKMADKEYGANALVRDVLNAVVSDTPVFAANIGSIVRIYQGGVCAYKGSLTTPPCTEAVTFLMQNKRQLVSKEQVHTYHLTCGGGMHGNNRPVQPLNGRKLTCYL